MLLFYTGGQGSPLGEGEIEQGVGHEGAVVQCVQ